MSTHDSDDFRDIPGATLPDGTPEPTIHPLIRFSVKNYVFSIGIFVMLVLAGLVTTFRLGVELLPNFEVPILAVSTGYPGANPDQVDREVSRKIEDAISTLAGVTDINTTSVSNQSAVVITFSDDTDIDGAANSVSQAVAAIRGSLPDGSNAPVVQKFDPNATPILTLCADLIHKKKPMANAPSKAPREYEPIAASVVSAAIPITARLSHFDSTRVIT